jgi:hypothetical protein
MTQDEIQNGDQLNQFDKERNPLPEDITEYVQKARNELKQYEKQKRYFEKHRKKEIVLGLIDLLKEHNYPKDWLRVIISRELGDYISTSYIEKILAEKYPEEKKNVKEDSTRQITQIPQIDDKIPLEVSTTGESIFGENNKLGNSNPYNTELSKVQVSSETKLERQAEKGAQKIVKKLQEKVEGLEKRCYQLDQLVQEGLVWKKKYNQLHQKFDSYRDKIIKGTAYIEFGTEVLPVKVEYNFKIDQFSARIPEEVIERIFKGTQQ